MNRCTNKAVNQSVLDHALIFTLHSFSLSTVMKVAYQRRVVSYSWPFPATFLCFQCPAAGSISQQSEKHLPRLHPLVDGDLPGLGDNKILQVRVGLSLTGYRGDKCSPGLVVQQC